MTLRGFVVALSAACTLAHFQAPVAGQQPTQVPTEVPTQLSPRLAPELNAAQQPRTTTSRISVQGCVERAQKNGSVGGTGLGTTSPPDRADDDANSSEPLDVFMLSNAQKIPRDASDSERTSYGLEGREQEMGAHTGHRVQITGSLVPPRTSAGSTAAAAAGIRRIRVEEVKMVSATCEAR